MHRVIICNKDVRTLTGKNQRQATSLITKMRKHYKKLRYQELTYYEFAEYTGVDIDTLARHLTEYPNIYRYTRDQTA